MSVPRASLSELLKESELTGRCFLVVEGPTDRRFLTQWLRSAFPDTLSSLTIMTPEGIEAHWYRLAEVGLSEGARQRVVWIALQIPSEAARVQCLADLDCGELAARFSSDRLWWTDHPAIESYAFEPETLDILNQMFLREQLPEGTAVVAELIPVLVDLFRIRLHNENIPAPAVHKGFGKNGWDPRPTVPPEIAARLSEFPSPSFEDPRDVAYGHDVAKALYSRFANEIKNRAKIGDLTTLEDDLRAALILSGAFAQSRLASQLLEWLEREAA